MDNGSKISCAVFSVLQGHTLSGRASIPPQTGSIQAHTLAGHAGLPPPSGLVVWLSAPCTQERAHLGMFPSPSPHSDPGSLWPTSPRCVCPPSVARTGDECRARCQVRAHQMRHGTSDCGTTLTNVGSNLCFLEEEEWPGIHKWPRAGFGERARGYSAKHSVTLSVMGNGGDILLPGPPHLSTSSGSAPTNRPENTGLLLRSVGCDYTERCPGYFHSAYRPEPQLSGLGETWTFPNHFLRGPSRGRVSSVLWGIAVKREEGRGGGREERGRARGIGSRKAAGQLKV